MFRVHLNEWGTFLLFLHSYSTQNKVGDAPEGKIPTTQFKYADQPRTLLAQLGGASSEGDLERAEGLRAVSSPRNFAGHFGLRSAGKMPQRQQPLILALCAGKEEKRLSEARRQLKDCDVISQYSLAGRSIPDSQYVMIYIHILYWEEAVDTRVATAMCSQASA